MSELAPAPTRPTSAADGRDPQNLVPLVMRLLELAADVAPESRTLQTETYREQLDLYRDQIRSASDSRHIENLLNVAVSHCEEFFGRSQKYMTAREKEFRELILILRDALSGFAGRGETFHGQMLETSARLSRLSELEDIRTLKRRLTEEVDTLKRAVEEKNREEQEHFSELTERVCDSESTLEQTKKEASLDGLTGVPNRRSYDITLDGWIREHSAQGSGFVYALVDLDDFKMVNDEHGHVVGDRVLRCAASTLSDGVRKGDFVARYGGEEFAVMLADTKLTNGRDRMADLVAKIGLSRYKYKHLGESRWVQFTVSAGVTEFVKGDDAESLVQRADEALYQAKRRGKNRVMTKKKGLFSRLG